MKPSNIFIEYSVPKLAVKHCLSESTLEFTTYIMCIHIHAHNAPFYKLYHLCIHKNKLIEVMANDATPKPNISRYVRIFPTWRAYFLGVC